MTRAGQEMLQLDQNPSHSLTEIRMGAFYLVDPDLEWPGAVGGTDRRVHDHWQLGRATVGSDSVHDCRKSFKSYFFVGIHDNNWDGMWVAF